MKKTNQQENRKVHHSIRHFVKGLSWTFIAVLVFTSAQAAVVANFNDGASTTAVDGYTGTAGNGWAGPWTLKTMSVITANATIESSTPLKAGAGNYLKVTMTSPGTGGGSYACATRNYAGQSDKPIDLNQPVKYQFLFRPESSSDYRYVFYDATIAQAATGPNCSWMLSIQGKKWLPYNGDGNGKGSEVSVPIPAETNTVYSVTIIADPAQKTWILQIADAATGALLYDSAASHATLGFRSQKLGGYIALGVGDGSPDKTPDHFGFSFDSVSIENASK